MKLKTYLKDKLYAILIFVTVLVFLVLLLLAFKVDSSLIAAVSITLCLSFFTTIMIDYIRKKSFYTNLLRNISKLDKAYLVTATIATPGFYEGRLLMDALYDIDKSMNENVRDLTRSLEDFKEYLSLWVHEVKIPISSLELMAHNHKELPSKTVLETTKRIDEYVETVLYYVRQETPEKDYLIRKVDVSRIVTNAALKNKDALLENEIDLIVSDIKGEVYTDSKWLEFILNQIISNAIKYRRVDVQSYIKIWTEVTDDKLILCIEDDGLGIASEDLGRVFDKSFTGKNGRKSAYATGMGLYIVKNLLTKLGHDISITSKEGEYTRVSITFFQNEYYEVVR